DTLRTITYAGAEAPSCAQTMPSTASPISDNNPLPWNWKLSAVLSKPKKSVVKMPVVVPRAWTIFGGRRLSRGKNRALAANNRFAIRNFDVVNGTVQLYA